MNKTRTIIIDGIEIQTSLTGVEIAGLVQRNKELEQQVKKQKEVIDKAMYKWIIEKFYGDSMVSTSKDGFKTYNQCLEDVLKHTTIDSAFRIAFEKEVLTLNIKIEKVESDE